MSARLSLVVALVTLTLFAGSAHAQSARDQVRALNQQAIEAYQSLEIDQAVALLERALVVADQAHLGGPELARTHANLGIVAVGGLSDTPRGIAHFQAALQADPQVALDPAITTPEVTAVFLQARARAAGQATPTQPTQPAGNSELTAGLSHTPPPEQLLRTPLPLHVAVSDTLPVSRVVVFYRSRGMRSFQELPLTAMVTGYGTELPCGDIFEPQVEYYMLAYDAAGARIGNVGSEQHPLSVRIVRTRRYAPPALPGRMPPEQCSDHECPPNLPSCRRDTPGNGTTRASRNDEEIVPSEEEEEDDANDVPRLYIQVGGVAGAGYARSNMPADRLPADPTSTSDAFIPSGEGGCDAPLGEYCVRVTTAGFIPVFGARLMLGYFVTPRVALSVGARYQINAGHGTLGHILLSFRTEILATTPKPIGFRALVHLGTSFGQIQVRPVQRGTDVEPFGQVGLGSAQVGTTLGYRFIRNLGVFVTPEVHVFYRDFGLALDVNLGLEAAF